MFWLCSLTCSFCIGCKHCKLVRVTHPWQKTHRLNVFHSHLSSQSHASGHPELSPISAESNIALSHALSALGTNTAVLWESHINNKKHPDSMHFIHTFHLNFMLLSVMNSPPVSAESNTASLWETCMHNEWIPRFIMFPLCSLSWSQTLSLCFREALVIHTLDGLAMKKFHHGGTWFQCCLLYTSDAADD